MLHPSFTTVAVFGILCAGLHWLAARASITEFFWRRAAKIGWLDALLSCPACSGWWIGLGLWGLRFRPLDGVFVAPHAPHGPQWVTMVAAHGVLGMVLTPIFEAVLLWGLAHSAIATANEWKTEG